MRRLTETERTAVVMQVAKNESENLLLGSPLVDYLAIEEANHEVVEMVANSVLAACNNYQGKVEMDLLTTGIALALFSTAASMFEDTPVEKILH